MRITKILFSITILGLLLFPALPAFAQNTQGAEKAGWLETIGIPGGHLIPTECTDSNPQTQSNGGCISNTGECTDCDLDEAFQVIVNFTQILLALAGSVAILMFVFGGTMMIISGTNVTGSGDQKKTINLGKEAIKAAVAGIVIMLCAWLVINFTIQALTGGKIGATAEIFNRDFNQQPSGSDSNNNNYNPLDDAFDAGGGNVGTP